MMADLGLWGVPPWGIGPLGLLVGAALVILGASGLGALLNWLCPAVTPRRMMCVVGVQLPWQENTRHGSPATRVFLPN